MPCRRNMAAVVPVAGKRRVPAAAERNRDGIGVDCMTQRTRVRWLVLAASALWSIAYCGHAVAQSRDKVSFRSIRVGYPPGPHTASPEEAMAGQRPPNFKAGAWTPVIVDVQNTGKYDPAADGPAFVSVEVPDSDDTLNSFTVPLPPFDEGGSSTAYLYTRPGSRYSDITVRVQAKGRELCKFDQRSYSGLDANQLVYLALGSRLPGLKVPGMSNEMLGGQQNAQRSEVGLITRVLDLPTLWIGYGSADVVILATSDRDFFTALVSDQSGRKAALAEWVRRGGKLIVCAGRDRDQFAGAPEIQALLPMTIEGPYVVPNATIRWESGSQAEDPLANPDDKPIEFTRLRARADRAARVLVDGPAGVPDAAPLVVQGPYGLGCVTLVAFDPDSRPVRGWNGEALFWEQLLRASGPRLASGHQGNQFSGFGRYGGDETDEMLQSLVSRLDQFEGVPVISFGWVALFILLY